MAGLGASYQKFARSGRAATIVLIGLIATVFVLAWLTNNSAFTEKLAFLGPIQPWGFVTYPFAAVLSGNGLIWLLLELLWLFWMGSDLESEIGAATMAGLFVISSLIGAIAVLACGRFFGGSIVIAGPLIPIGAVTVAWGMRNPDRSIRLWAIIPVTGMWIAIIQAGVVLFSMGQRFPLRGVFALIPLALAWAYAVNRIPGLRFGPFGSTVREGRALKMRERKNTAYFNDVRKREKERADKERLRKLLEGSISDEPGEDK